MPNSLRHRFRCVCEMLSIIVIGLVGGCSHSGEAVAARILIAEDTTVLVLTPEVGSFKVNVAVLNEGPATIYLGGCGPDAQRQIDSQWVTVWSPICVGTFGRTPIASGDSLKFPVVVYGFRVPNREPALDARVQGGMYRLRFGLATKGVQGTEPSELFFRASTNFTVVDTTNH